MTARYFKFLVLVASSILFFSCEEKLQTEFGNVKVFFSNTSAAMALSDSVSLVEMASRPDTTVSFIGIYRSGISDTYERLTVSIEIDSAYLADQIAAAQTALPSAMTDLMTRYKNSNALGTSFCSIPSTVVIPEGQRKISVPVVLHKGLIEGYGNAYFNYSKADFSNSNITKDRMLVIPLKISAVSPVYPILESRQRSFIEITKHIGIIH